ncbi:MAG TPA: hypothetical protein ENI89_11655 [Desulfobulbus sp.]|nr:hypothetical protein [Desulfobulbus sp.]
MKGKISFVCIVSLLFLAAQAMAVPTSVTVRVKARDAKFIGTSFGGILITIRNADTGELLAKGVTQGSTGDTKVLMKQPLTRFETYARKQDAGFTTTLDIDEPTRIEVAAFGPLAQRQGANRVTATQWIVPGKDLTGGNGWVLEMPGFVVDVLAPPSHIKLDAATTTVPIRANVTMMCGCPITKGGVWDADRYQVAARIIKNGKQLAEIPLNYLKKASQFGADYTVNAGPGVYKAVVYAYDPSNGNTGVDVTTFIVKKPKKKK